MTRIKNVLIVTPTKVGLTETFIRAHIEQLDARVFYLYGWELDFKTADDVPLWKLYQPQKTFINRLQSLLPHYLYFRIEQRRRQQYTKEALIKRYIKEYQIDVVLAEYGTAGSFITPVCKDLNIPLVVHFHGFDASNYGTYRLFKDRYKKMFNYARAIIAVSKAMQRALVTYGCPEDKIVINTYGPHDAFFNVNVDYNSKQIITVGRHTYQKAPYLSILAFKSVLERFPDAKFVMIGDGELYEVSNNMVQALDLERNIILLGALERNDIIKEISKSCMYIQHSLVARNGDSEGTPVSIIEAMASGLPVVSTRHAGIPDVVIEEETGLLVDEKEVEQMAKCIIRLLENKELAMQMGISGRNRIRSHFSLEKHIGVIQNILENL